jgi:hypothetical protein
MLNQKFSKFQFNFPKGFLDPRVESRFLEFIQKMPFNYSDSLAFLNSTIQGISFPGFTVEGSSQRLDREPTTWKSGIQLHASITKEITISFRMIDGMLNWFILFLNTEYFLELESNDTFFPDFIIRILDSNNKQIYSIKLLQPRIVSLSEANLSYSTNNYDSKEFTATFAYNRYNLQYEED